MEHDMFFLNPTFNPGLNVTVRNGDKWLKVNAGDVLNLKKTGDDRTILKAEVLFKAYLPFLLIPKEWLEAEHDYNCHTIDGLFKVMSYTYPGFIAGHYVTVIFFSLNNIADDMLSLVALRSH